jgi:hypothetical protein
MHALTAWDIKFQICLGYTFTPATLNPVGKNATTGAIIESMVTVAFSLVTLGKMTQTEMILFVSSHPRKARQVGVA